MRDGWEQAVVEFIRSQQQADGSFVTELSTSPRMFQTTHHTKTVFMTALILRFLHTVPHAHDIADKAAAYLLAQQQKHGTWNYWERGSDEGRLLPLPDDLDDTACALAALLLHDKLAADGHLQATLARVLIASETAPGGPYRTWVPTADMTGWDDVDPAVNANIGYLLSLQDVTLAPLVRYFDTALEQKTLTSPYYLGTIPTLFFLTEWYRGPRLSLLKRQIVQALKRKNLTALELSFLILAGHNVQLSPAHLARAQARLRALRTHNHCPANALYLHLAHTSQSEYAGSAVLASVCALRALRLPEGEKTIHPKTKNTPQNAATLGRANTAATSYIRSPDLRSTYRKCIAKIISADKTMQITDAAGLVARAFAVTVPESTLQHLNLGSLNGWAAYTIYDDILDGDKPAAYIPVANIALRESRQQFQAALPDRTPYQRLVDETFAAVDAANYWEARHARAQIHQTTLSYAHLPDYDDHDQLAARSKGHMLAACGVLFASPSEHDSQRIPSLQAFFHHYLIARQLHDDAHDWHADLCRGHLTAVVTQLLRTHGSSHIDLARDLPQLKQLFWTETVSVVTELIVQHISEAKRALTKTNCARPDLLLSWLTPLEEAARTTQTQQQHATAFIAAYKTDNRA